MVFAKTAKAAARLSESIRNKEFNKCYLVIADGKFEKERGVLEDYLLKNEKTNIVTVNEKGKDCVLNYEFIDYKDNYSLVKVNLITGRHHQIRLQFASRNNPLYGDQLYGVLDKKQIALFAYHLRFKHPVKDEIMDFKIVPKTGIWSEFDYEA